MQNVPQLCAMIKWATVEREGNDREKAEEMDCG
jgi:hypothetical protein